MLRLATLGRLELSRDGVPLLAGRRKLLAVLAYLVCARGKSVTRPRLADLFWQSEDETRSRRSVRQALTELRPAVGEALIVGDDSVAIAAGAIELDAFQLETALGAGDPEAAVALWGGDFLTEAESVGDEDFRIWLEGERQALRARYARALTRLIDQAELQGSWDVGLALTRALLEVLPYDEEANARHTRLLSLAGRPPIKSPAGKGLLSPDLIGREAEFSRLTALWERIAGGGSGLALVEGEDGSGKTRLATEFLRWAAQQAPRPLVLHARAFEAEQSRPAVLLRHLLAGLAKAPGLAAAPAGTLRMLGTLVPEIAERFPTLPGSDRASTLAEAVTRALSDVAAEQPVVLVVDDADLADSESREVLEALCRRPVAGTLTVLTALPEVFPGIAAAERLALGALSEPQLERLLDGMAEFVPADRTRLARALHDESGGNPLAAVELVTTLADRGTIAPGPGGLWVLATDLDKSELPLPVSLRNMAAARIRGLAPDAARVLEAAAGLGRDAELGTLREVTGLGAARLDEALDQLIAGRLLRLSGDGSLRVEFLHEIVRRAAVAHHRTRMGRTRRRLVWVAAAGLLLALGAGAALRSRSVVTTPHSVAVLPFAVKGNARVRYLSEGMVTLLGSALDGLGGLSSVDSRRILFTATDTAPNPERGRATAQRLGAGLFVLGDIVETDRSLELEASLYDAQGRRQSVARATAASEAGIGPAVEELAKQLVVGRHDGPGAGISRAAAMTTSSLPALKAWLGGERELRAGNFAAAVDSFQTAVVADSTFALAYYRLAIAAEWDQRGALPEQAARQAARYRDRLTERTRALVDALLAWRSGDVVGARDRYVDILSHHPDEVEAWFQLGEVLFHGGPLLGSPVGAAKVAWQHVLALEPGDRFALVHLARIAASEADSTGLARLVPAAPDLEGAEDRRLLELAAWRAMVLHNDAEANRVLGYLRKSLHSGVVFWELLTYSRDLDWTGRFIRDAKQQGTGLLLLQVELGRGRWRSALAQLGSGNGMDRQAIVSRGYLASLPFVTLSADQLRRVRAEVERWKPQPPALPPEQVRLTSYHALLYPEIRHYLLAALSTRLGDLAGARGHAAAIQRAPSGPERVLVGDLALGARAMVARSEGNVAEATAMFDSLRLMARREELFTSPLYSRALERYHRGELLQELGQPEAALQWFESMAQLSIYELAFLAPASLHRAELYEQLGRRDEAAVQYARFIELWKDADPEAQPVVARARARLAALTR